MSVTARRVFLSGKRIWSPHPSVCQSRRCLTCPATATALLVHGAASSPSRFEWVYLLSIFSCSQPLGCYDNLPACARRPVRGAPCSNACAFQSSRSAPWCVPGWMSERISTVLQVYVCVHARGDNNRIRWITAIQPSYTGGRSSG